LSKNELQIQEGEELHSQSGKKISFTADIRIEKRGGRFLINETFRSKREKKRGVN